VTDHHPIRRVRRAADWTQFELGRRVGRSGSWISKLELRQITPSNEIMSQLAQALRVPPENLELQEDEIDE